MSQPLGQALAQACRQFDAAPALQGQAAVLSYAALAGHAQGLAAQLRGAGLQADEPVLVMVSNQPVDIAAMLAVWLAGGVVVAVHRSTPPALRAALQQRTGARLGLDQADSAATIDTPPAGGLLRWPGPPRLLQFQPTDRCLLVLNLSFGFGLWLALLTLLRGGILVLAPKFDAAEFLHTLASQRITQVGLVPTMMRVVLADPALAPAIAQVATQGDLRQILMGGELLGLSLAETLRRQFANTRLVDIYGLTETSTCDFFAFPADYALRPGCIGRPAPQVQHRIADAQGMALPPGVVGELQLRSPYLMAGYLDAPELTAAAYQGDWFRTGDLACQHADGLVVLMGRQKELISRAGNKVTPVEVEQALSAHPDVAAAMAVGVADVLLGERIHVLVVARPGSTLCTAALRQHLAGRLEKFKHPDTWHVADALPLGRTGKADRGALAAHIAAGQTEPLPP